MQPTPSNSTQVLLRPDEVAERAQVSKNTLYLWMRGPSPLVVPSHECKGEPLFSEAAARDVVALAEHRRALREAMRLPGVLA